jgi:hypothetical protein
MKDRLLIATLAGVGLLAALGVAAVCVDLWRPAAVAVAPVTATPAPAADAAMPSDPQPDSREDAASGPAPSYEAEAAARDRAAGHGARSR